MLVEAADRRIVDWARSRSAPCYYTDEPELPGPCLKVQCGHATAYFNNGRLVRLWAQADHAFLDDLFAELADLFAACIRSRPDRNGSGLGAVALPRVRWDG